MSSTKQVALLLGFLASLFFAITFVVNRLMSLNDGVGFGVLPYDFFGCFML
ncbi:hypothetical protein [Sphingobacterium olei]|uniref:hypothetical protein n=1 Tax=Sphingobacterium olei TaxID=2571155 RepID=UPI00138FFF3B|nr:hypothetical protein [Sphingobacterium olei]